MPGSVTAAAIVRAKVSSTNNIDACDAAPNGRKLNSLTAVAVPRGGLYGARSVARTSRPNVIVVRELFDTSSRALRESELLSPSSATRLS